MKFDISYDKNGKPDYVNTFDGFAHIGRAFNPDQDGWMLDQLNVRDFPLIGMARDMEDLIYEVNALRRENFQLKQQLKMWSSF